MSTCLVTGSFDPLTLGHFDVIVRAGKLFDKVIVSILVNPMKKYLFSVEERTDMIRKAVEGFPNISVVSYAGLAVNLAKELGAVALVRGIRNVKDCDYEREMSEYNYETGGIDTICLFTAPEHRTITATETRRRLASGESIDALVPANIIDMMTQLYKRRA